jgi:hypothetical protein
MGYMVQVHCPSKDDIDGTDFTAVDHVKLFRNSPTMRFEGRIHEQILGAITGAGGHVAATDLFVVHSGYDHSPEGQKRKLERDLRILHAEYQDDPRHPFTLFNLGMTYTDCGEYARAVEYLQESKRYSAPHQHHLRKVYAYLTHCQTQLGQAEEAWRTCQQ